ncbi:ABC transporter substrate-binding protein [soil metagenome]
MSLKINLSEYKYFTVVLFFVIILLLPVSNSVFSQSTEIEEPIKIGLTNWSPSSLLYIAEEKGFFEKNNVNVKLVLKSDYSQLVDGYYYGDYDGIIAVFADILFLESQGVDSKVVYVVDISETADVIIGKGNNLSETKGNKIGVEQIHSFSHLFVLNALEKVGLEESDLEFVSVAAQNVTQMIDDGGIFAGHTYEPYTSQALESDYNILFTAGDIPGIITDTLTFDSDLIEQRPQEIEAIVKSFVESLEYYNNYKDDALQIMASNIGISKQEVDNAMKSVKLVSLNENKLLLGNQSQYSSFYNIGNKISKWLVESGQISEFQNINELVELKFINELLMEKIDKK